MASRTPAVLQVFGLAILRREAHGTPMLRSFSSTRVVASDDQKPHHEMTSGQILETGAPNMENPKLNLKDNSRPSVDPNWWSKQEDAKWWHPDPVSGMWVPEDKFGSISAVELRPKRRPRGSLDERGWWTSLEEMPDFYNRPTHSRR
eukprot:TRINITY_DN39067_c0_g1_i1.p1 TRINITY_DN39067_c0_g1~~TRINITY_DN39067_c0_g1_i1.p1  ORF type:complete len:147 (+),score=20.71 TRINITY_DN39067_c0_g1_i1:149-589(+)